MTLSSNHRVSEDGEGSRRCDYTHRRRPEDTSAANQTSHHTALRGLAPQAMGQSGPQEGAAAPGVPNPASPNASCMKRGACSSWIAAGLPGSRQASPRERGFSARLYSKLKDRRTRPDTGREHAAARRGRYIYIYIYIYIYAYICIWGEEVAACILSGLGRRPRAAGLASASVSRWDAHERSEYVAAS